MLKLGTWNPNLEQIFITNIKKKMFGCFSVFWMTYKMGMIFGWGEEEKLPHEDAACQHEQNGEWQNLSTSDRASSFTDAHFTQRLALHVQELWTAHARFPRCLTYADVISVSPESNLHMEAGRSGKSTFREASYLAWGPVILGCSQGAILRRSTWRQIPSVCAILRQPVGLLFGDTCQVFNGRNSHC